MAFAAEGSGRVLYVDFSDLSKGRICRPENGAGGLEKILPAKSNGLFWALSIEVEGANGSNLDYTNLELIKENGKEILYHSRIKVRDFIVSNDGNILCLVAFNLSGGVDVQIFKHEKETWEKCGERTCDLNMDRVVFLDQPTQQLALISRGGNWLEVWEITGSLKTIAEAALPDRATCLATLDDHIVVGGQSGALISYRLEWRRNNAIV